MCLREKLFFSVFSLFVFWPEQMIMKTAADEEVEDVYIMNQNKSDKNFSDPSDLAEAMEVTSSGPQTIQKAQGETVNLGCTYTPAPQDTGELDIEWSNVSPDMTQKDKLVGV